MKHGKRKEYPFSQKIPKDGNDEGQVHELLQATQGGATSLPKGASRKNLALFLREAPWIARALHRLALPGEFHETPLPLDYPLLARRDHLW